MADEVLILTSLFKDFVELPYYEGGIKAGFPSPAQDYLKQSLDFNRDLIQHPEATYYARVVGDSMKDAGITEGDILVIDRAPEAHDGDIIVAFINGEFTLKYLDMSHKDEGYINLVPANENYPTIKVAEDDQFTIWGVVLWTIKKPQRNNL